MIACSNCHTTRFEFDRMVIECVPLVNLGLYHYVCCESPFSDDERLAERERITSRQIADLDSPEVK